MKQTLAVLALTLAATACGGGGDAASPEPADTQATAAPATTTTAAPATTIAPAPAYDPVALNDTGCGKWLEEGRTVEGLRAMVLENHPFDWKLRRDFNRDGYPCEDEVGTGYLPTTTTTAAPTTTTEAVVETSTPATEATTTTTTAVATTTEPVSEMDPCLAGILADLGWDEYGNQVGERNLYFPTALRDNCSDVEFEVNVSVLSRIEFNQGGTDGECVILADLYFAAPPDSKAESLLANALNDCL